MADLVEIVNRAFVRLGQARISSLSDPGKPARIAAGEAQDLLDEELQAHPWNFATFRAALAADSAVPEWGYNLQYSLPEGTIPPYCLRVLSVNGEDANSGRWKIEGNRKLVTDLQAPLEIQYIGRVLDPSQMPAKFKAMLAAKYAMEWCKAITGDDRLKEGLVRDFRMRLMEARNPDGQEGTSDPLDAGSWIESRW